MLNCSIRLCVTNAPWLKVSSMATAIISKSDWLCCTFYGTTHMLRTSSVPIESHWMSSTLAQLLVIDFRWCWELSFVVPSFFLYWKPCTPVYMFSFLDNYMLYVLVKYFHSNHNTTPVLPKICFSLQPPYHWKSCIHLNCDVYYIVNNFPVFVHPEKFSHLSHLFHLQTLQHNCLYYIIMNATGLVLNSLSASQGKILFCPLQTQWSPSN